jgi:hypothetical protein
MRAFRILSVDPLRRGVTVATAATGTGPFHQPSQARATSPRYPSSSCHAQPTIGAGLGQDLALTRSGILSVVFTSSANGKKLATSKFLVMGCARSWRSPA